MKLPSLGCAPIDRDANSKHELSSKSPSSVAQEVAKIAGIAGLGDATRSSCLLRSDKTIRREGSHSPAHRRSLGDNVIPDSPALARNPP